MTPNIALQQLRNIADGLHASGCHWRSERITESADAIETAMREKETWLSPECYEELMRERQETLHEMSRLKEMLKEAREDIHDDVANRYPEKDKYPAEMRRYERDMDIVWRIDAALAGKEDV